MGLSPDRYGERGLKGKWKVSRSYMAAGYLSVAGRNEEQGNQWFRNWCDQSASFIRVTTIKMAL